MESRMGSSIVVIGVVAVSWFMPGAAPPSPDEIPELPPLEAAAPGEVPELPAVTLDEPEVLSVRVRPEALSRSGALRYRPVMPGEQLELPLEWLSPRPAEVRYRWVEVKRIDGDEVGFGRATASSVLADGEAVAAPETPGIYRMELVAAGQTVRIDAFDLVVQVPFQMKERGYLKGYLIGTYPTERENRQDRYAPPVGFIEVTPENQSLRLSEHFTLREFLTKNQQNVWPKYVVVDPLLLDKLELVMQDLNARGIEANRMVVMSGFRTPQYNRQGLNRGRASLSRHQYGDAADVWIDNDGDWYMDDLNGDGRRDTRDARVMLESVDRVEARYPELVGGAGIYPDNGAHGPFIHIDVRGRRARW